MKRILLALTMAFTIVIAFASPAFATYGRSAETEHYQVGLFDEDYATLYGLFHIENTQPVADNIGIFVQDCGQYETWPMRDVDVYIFAGGETRWHRHLDYMKSCQIEWSGLEVTTGPGADCLRMEFTGFPRIDNFQDPGLVGADWLTCHN